MIKLLLTFTIVMVAAHMGLGGLIHSHDEDVAGDWEITLKVVGGQAQGTMNLKIDGKKLSGTVESAHTGPGTIRDGKIDNGKLTFTAEFAKHESIAFSGATKDGKLQGEFRTEGNVGNWVATRHGSKAEVVAPSASSRTTVDGEWSATLSGNGTTAPLDLKLGADGEKVSGTFASEHLGLGTVEGSIRDGKVALTLKLAKSSIELTGSLADGKLAGDFGSGPMKGTWTAVAK